MKKKTLLTIIIIIVGLAIVIGCTFIIPSYYRSTSFRYSTEDFEGAQAYRVKEKEPFAPGLYGGYPSYRLHIESVDGTDQKTLSATTRINTKDNENDFYADTSDVYFSLQEGDVIYYGSVVNSYKAEAVIIGLLSISLVIPFFGVIIFLVQKIKFQNEYVINTSAASEVE